MNDYYYRVVFRTDSGLDVVRVNGKYEDIVIAFEDGTIIERVEAVFDDGVVEDVTDSFWLWFDEIYGQ